MMRWLSGWVWVQYSGGDVSRLVSLAMGEGLRVFDVQAAQTGARMGVLAADYRALSRLARRCGGRVHILRRRGLIRSRRTLLRRVPLAAGLAVFCATLFLLGETVFTVEIEGSSAIPRAAVEQSLARAGVTVGCFRRGVDVKRAEQTLLLDNDRLSWAALNLSFGRAAVVVKDKTPAPQSGVGTAGMKLVAARDARITRIDLVGGVPLVRVGDVVAAGQELALPDVQAGAASWAAAVRGEVYAYTAYKETFVLPLRVADRTQTGQISRRVRLVLGALSLPLTPQSCPYAFFDAYTYTRPLTLFSVRLPFYLQLTDYCEVTQRETVLTPETARLRLEAEAAAFLRETGAQKRVVGHSAEFAQTRGRYHLTLRYTCEENVGIYMECE